MVCLVEKRKLFIKRQYTTTDEQTEYLKKTNLLTRGHAILPGLSAILTAAKSLQRSGG